MATILIAEDDPTVRKTIGVFVETLGHRPLLSPNGRHALELLEAGNQVDMVITDMMMPEMDGRQLVEAVRASDALKALPVVIISAYIGVKDIADLLKAGATMFQPKPLRLDELEECIDCCLANRLEAKP